MASYKQFDKNSADDDNIGSSKEKDSSRYSSTTPKSATAAAQLKGFRLIVIGCVIFAAGVTLALVIDIILKDPITGHGAVSSDVGECSVIGAKLMKTGANGIDAAVATAFCVSVYNLGSSGIASGGYMLIHGPNGADRSIDFQFMASANATENMFANDSKTAERGGLSVAIPGFVHGLMAAHDKFGKIAWSKLLKPSIHLAREGFELQAYGAQTIKDNFDSMSQELKDMISQDGKIPMVGAVIKMPKLAEAFEEIATLGRDAVYSKAGKIGKDILETVSFHGGILTEFDLASYRPIVSEVVGAEYNGYRVLTSKPPSSGIALLSALKAIDQFHLSAKDDVNSFQVIVEAMKFAFAGRSLIGDPLFRPEMSNVSKLLLSSELAESIKSNISLNATHDASYYRTLFTPSKTPGTSTVSVMGPNDELVSITTTLGMPFGSGLVTKSGIVLNDGMVGFAMPASSGSAQPNKANLIEPLKRPLCPATPVIIFNKEKPCQDMFVLGAAGGEKLMTSLLQVIVNLLSYQMPLDAAIERPRVHHQLYPNVLLAEGNRFQKVDALSHVIASLRNIGHNVDDTPLHLGMVNGVALKEQTIIAHSDTRINGSAAQF